jgi:hypothetical protein
VPFIAGLTSIIEDLSVYVKLFDEVIQKPLRANDIVRWNQVTETFPDYLTFPDCSLNVH